MEKRKALKTQNDPKYLSKERKYANKYLNTSVLFSYCFWWKTYTDTYNLGKNARVVRAPWFISAWPTAKVWWRCIYFDIILDNYPHCLSLLGYFTMTHTHTTPSPPPKPIITGPLRSPQASDQVWDISCAMEGCDSCNSFGAYWRKANVKTTSEDVWLREHPNANSPRRSRR